MGYDKLVQKKKELSRREKTRQLRRLLIVCEGGKTEPNYFKKFKANNPEVFNSIDIQGTGYNTVSLVKKAIELQNEARKAGNPYIETWCVFDKDDFPVESFENAIRLANENKIKCAYSIEAFEIWYLLHFNFYNSALSRSQYKDMLSDLLQKTYHKNDDKMYQLLQSRQSKAIQNARRLYNQQSSLPFKEQNPVTTVFLLVERLIE